MENFVFPVNLQGLGLLVNNQYENIVNNCVKETNIRRVFLCEMALKQHIGLC